jgi:hypothetical protein
MVGLVKPSKKERIMEKIPKTPKAPRAPKAPFTPERIEKMQAGRKLAKTQATQALEVVTGNDQLTNPKFWSKIPADKVQAIQKAMTVASDKAKQAEIDELEARIATLRGE